MKNGTGVSQMVRIKFVALDTCYHAPATDYHLNPLSSPPSAHSSGFTHKSPWRCKAFTIDMNHGKRRVDRRSAAADGNDSMVIQQIMLRFRPIAPRPTTGESSGGVLPEKDVKRTRVKRKYVRVKKTKRSSNNNYNNNDDKSMSLGINGGAGWFDLDRTVAMIDGATGSEIVVADPMPEVSNWISFNIDAHERKGVVNHMFESESPEKFSPDLHGVDLATAVRRRSVAESWITVESVTGACEDRRLLGLTDDEIWKNLETDSCPSFITSSYESYNKVQWVNPAYRSMLDLNSDGDSQATDVVVWLVVKVEKSTLVQYLPAFSCRVRVEYISSEKKTRMMVPCDVCKMDSGAFAWRLDVKFALSLGPLS